MNSRSLSGVNDKVYEKEDIHEKGIKVTFFLSIVASSLKTKNQIQNLFVLISVVIAIQKDARFQQNTTKYKEFWFLVTG